MFTSVRLEILRNIVNLNQFPGILYIGRDWHEQELKLLQVATHYTESILRGKNKHTDIMPYVQRRKDGGKIAIVSYW